MRNLFLSGLFLLALASCCKEKDALYDLCTEPEIGNGDCITDSNQVKPLLLGKWNWTQTVSEAWTTYKKNPCSDSIYYSYEFLPLGRVNIFENGQFTSTANYAFVQNWESQIIITDTFFNPNHPMIYNFSGGVSICGKYLIIDDSPVDGPKLIFRRTD
ncbi:MAG: hypothetical protein U0T74_05100 [Chitinophagales bacterium]